MMFTRIYFALVEKGVGVPVFNHYPGKCRVVSGLECGSEDFAVTKDGLAFISNGVRVSQKCNYTLYKGSFYLFDFKNPDANVTKLKIISETLDFDKLDPIGMTLWEDDETQKISLFVIDHGLKNDVVHVFEYDRSEPTKLFLKETIKDQSFVCINDLIAIGPRSFYITNFIAFCRVSSAAIGLEYFFKIKSGNVVFFDGEKGRIVANGLAMSNGINISPDGKYVYVAAGSSHDLLIFKRDFETNDITLIKEIALMTSPDNLEVDRDNGDIYIGAHKNYKMIFGSYNGTFAAPAQVVRVRCPPENWDKCSVIEILSTDGIDFVRGSSVAHFRKGGLLIGTVYHRLGYCHDVKVP